MGRLPSNRILHSQLVGVSPFDPATIVRALLLLIGVALLACGVPAGRAIRQPGRGVAPRIAVAFRPVADREPQQHHG